MDKIAAAYDSYATHVTAAALEFWGDRPIEELWLYTDTMFGTASTEVYFRAGGRFVTAGDVATKDRSRVDDVADMHDAIVAQVWDLMDALAEADEAPDRIVARVELPSREVSTHFESGILEGPDDLPHKAEERWAEEKRRELGLS